MAHKKDVAIAFGITGNYVKILANTLIGLTKYSKKFWDDIIIFHQGISKEDQKRLNKIVKCNFIEVSGDTFVKIISPELIKLYSVATFFRFESFKLLDSYHKVIWSDVDVLYQKDISSLLKYGDKSGYAATIATPNYKVASNFYRLINDYNMFVPMYNAGLFVITDKLPNYQVLPKWCYETTKKYASILKWLDQGVLNLLVQEFKIEVEEIELDKYHCHPSNLDNSNEAFILHAHGTRKFWNDDEYKNLYPEWHENNMIWDKICCPPKAEKDKGEKTNANPKISVIMTIYKRYQFVDEAINSILSQTFNDFELLISIEKTEKQLKIAKHLKKYKDKRIKIILNEKNLGFPESLNQLIEISKGDYIARMDDDDISLPKRFEIQFEFLKNNPDVGICGTNAENFMYSSGKWFDGYISSDEIKAKLLHTNPICHPSILMRKDLLLKYGLKYNKEYFSEDYEFWAQAAKHFKIVGLEPVLLNYRASNTNLTTYGLNEDKIQESVKKTMRHQFKETLGLDFNDNELELIQTRKPVLNNEDWQQSAIELQQDIYKRIIKANKTVKFYDNSILMKELGYLCINGQKNIICWIKTFIKKVIKKLFRFIYVRLEYRIDRKINSRFNDLSWRIDMLEKKMSKEKKQKVEE